MNTRVVITGIGIVSPAGVGKTDFWQGLMCGRSNVERVPWSKASPLRCTRVCCVPGQTKLRRTAKTPNAVRFTLSAAQEALHDSGLDRCRKGLRIGVTLGTAVGGVESCIEGGPLLMQDLVQPANVVAEHFALSGPVSTVPVACAAGAMALIHAFMHIQNNRADVVLAGGFDEVSEIPFAGFLSLHVLTNDLIRPFDRNRTGFLIGEGAGILVLERLEAAQKRGAHIYGEVRGFGISSDAFHVIHPHPQAHGLIQAMTDALKMADCEPDDITYVNSHGTATKLNDTAESRALKSVFAPKNGKKIVTSSFKSVLGHTMGAAGAIETIGCLLSLRHQTIAPTWNFEEMDPECDVDCVPNRPRTSALNTIMKNSSGFGGTNCSLVLSTC
jgi:3-oxoacyl-[acyl-carrier-protein] synthase II